MGRSSSLLRGAGVAAAVLLPDRAGRRSRAAVTGSTYALGEVLDPDGIQVLSMTLDDDRFPAWLNRAFPQATATLSWVLGQQLLVPAARRLPVPRPLAALALGGAVVAADIRLADKVTAARAQAAAAPVQPAETPEPEPAANG